MSDIKLPTTFDDPFLLGGGEMGALIRAYDWQVTPIGLPSGWPEALKQTISMVLTTPLPVLVCWGANYIQFYNDAFRPILGRSKHPQALGISAAETYAEIWETIGPMFSGVMNGEAVGFPDFMVPLDRNGYTENCYFDFSYSPIRDTAGMVSGVLVICMETTEKVLSLQKLEKANQETRIAQASAENERDRLERFFMQAPAGICVLDGPEMVFVMINPLYQQFFPGRPLLGKTLADGLPEIIGQPIWDIIQGVYHTGKTFEGKEMLVPLARKDEAPLEDRYFNFIYQARIAGDKTVNGIIVFAIEVTDIVLTKRKLQESADHYRAQLNAIPQIAWTNAAGGEVDFYNQRWYDYTGLDFERSKTLGWKEVVHLDDQQRNLDNYQAIRESGKAGEYEIREKRRDGVYRWHLIRMVPINNEAGELQHWIGTATDIHDLKVLQEQKDDFISIASHELKTPVTSLKASLQLLDRLKSNPSAAMLPKLIEQCNKSAGKISELIEDLLDASKLNESQLHIHRKIFNMSELLEGCCSHVRAAGKHELIFSGNRELTVLADVHRIDQVVVNFVNNAVKYAPGSKEIYLIVEKSGQDIKVSVKDNGPGIAPAKLPHLFHKYYRAEYTGAQYSGLGLGLYISAEIVRRHGGQIGVDSEPGKGSSFWFTLPV